MKVHHIPGANDKRNADINELSGSADLSNSPAKTKRQQIAVAYNVRKQN